MEESKQSLDSMSEFMCSLSMGFWYSYANLKLTELKLDDSALRLEATYHFPQPGAIAYL